MSFHSSRPSQSHIPHYDPSTPPPPPPKPPALPQTWQTAPADAAHSQPPYPGGEASAAGSGDGQYNAASGAAEAGGMNVAPTVEDGWLPDGLRDKSTPDLQAILSSPDLQRAFIHSSTTAHQLLKSSTSSLQDLLSQNLALTAALSALESQIHSSRSQTQSRLLSLRALERQWRTKQTEQDQALRDFSPPVLYQCLNAAVAEQEALARSMEEGFVSGEDGDGVMGEREVGEFVRRYREVVKVGWLRRERRERWDEGRVGGWR